jgi:hypothetical protein
MSQGPQLLTMSHGPQSPTISHGPQSLAQPRFKLNPLNKPRKPLNENLGVAQPLASHGLQSLTMSQGPQSLTISHGLHACEANRPRKRPPKPALGTLQTSSHGLQAAISSHGLQATTASQGSQLLARTPLTSLLRPENKFPDFEYELQALHGSTHAISHGFAKPCTPIRRVVTRVAIKILIFIG